MKSLYSPSKLKTVLFTVFALFFTINLQAQEEPNEEDKTLSPFFFVKGNDDNIDQLPLKSTTANVNISGVMADVTVRQTYCNTGQVPLEAIYIFPASTKAAVYSMQMEIGDRILIAEIREAEQAREEYEEAKEEGKTTSLLEQQRPNVFQMNVANIMPGDTINVEMKYVELITPTDGIYEFIYPTVVGPRYAEISAGEDSSWVEIPYTHEGEAPTYDFDINVNLNAGMKIQSVESPSHETLEIDFPSQNSAICSLPEEAKKSGNKDFVLHYQLSSDRLESGMLLYEGEDENFFLTMVQPPWQVYESEIPPREYVFIMDVSGSMNGFPISISKTVLTDLISNLKPTDKFNVMCFAGGSQVLSEKSLDASQENIDKALDMISNKQGSGGTNMLAALKKAFALKGTENYSRTFVVVTDGYVTIEKEAFTLIRNSLSEANVFAFGIGSSVNRYLIEGLARVGMGEPFVILNQEEAPEKAEKFRKYIQSPVLTNIDVDFSNFQVNSVEPPTVPDVFAERPILIFGKYEDTPQGSFEISGLSGSHDFHQKLYVNNYPPSEQNSALKYLWARHVIQQLDDYGQLNQYGEENEAVKEEIIELGLKYNLLTRYTSFIAIDSLIRNTGDSTATVTQPLPLPAGVSDLAVGSYGGGGNTSALYSADAFKRFGGEQQVAENRSTIDQVYPNPASEKFKVWLSIQETDKEGRIALLLFDNLGHKLDEVEVHYTDDGYIRVGFDLANYSAVNAGVYRLTLLIDGKPIDSKNIAVSQN
ncbi:MAG: VIT and vWA domain-containing protein [Bacteroidota bacterium]